LGVLFEYLKMHGTTNPKNELLIWLVEILKGAACQIFVDAVWSLDVTKTNEIHSDLYHFFGPTGMPTSSKDAQDAVKNIYFDACFKLAHTRVFLSSRHALVPWFSLTAKIPNFNSELRGIIL
jgi:hypothetical protein